jgi:flagellar motor switch protein FliG
MPARDDYRTLTGPEKAAILMLSLGEQLGAPVWQGLDDDEVKELCLVMASLGNVQSTLVERLLVEFAGQLHTTGTIHGNFESTESLLAKMLPGERVSAIMEEIRGPAGRTMWEKLGNVKEEVLANYLKNEYPQTVAVILSKLKSDHGARVLTQLPKDFALEVVSRMLSMEVVQREILDTVEHTLRSEFMSNLARTNRRDPHEMMAEIFNNLDRNTESMFMTALEDRNRDAAERIRQLMFTFEDLIKLDPSGVQTLLRNFDKNKLAIALKGASEPLRDLIFSNMSERAGKILREDMQSMGPVRLKEVDEAQMAMVAIAKDLAAKGEIMLADKKSSEDELVY